MPWAKRPALVRHVRERLYADAKRKYEPSENAEGDVEANALKAPNLARTAEILKDSLEAIAVDKQLSLENVALREKIERMSEEIKRLRQAADESR